MGGPDGTVYEGELHAGDQSAVKEGIAITITVGGSSADNVIATGYAVTADDDIEYKGLYELDLKGNDNIITMVSSHLARARSLLTSTMAWAILSLFFSSVPHKERATFPS